MEARGAGGGGSGGDSCDYFLLKFSNPSTLMLINDGNTIPFNGR